LLAVSPETTNERSPSIEDVRRRHPRFVSTVLEDARIAAAFRGERHEFRSRVDGIRQALRLMWTSDAFLAHVCYRAKARGQALGIPVLPRIAHRIAMATAQVCIGDPVVMEPGVYIAHGQVVVDGFTEVRSGTVLFPWVTVGLRAGNFVGPVIGRNVRLGTGSKVLGPITVGQGASIGANAVVVTDVPPRATAVGVPARVIKEAPKRKAGKAKAAKAATPTPTPTDGAAAAGDDDGGRRP
jgi:serine O-acetyltransferase